MNLLGVWQEAILNSWSQVWSAFFGFIPVFLGAILIFIIGILVSGWAKKLIEQALGFVHLEDLSRTSGFASYLERADIKLSATEILGNIVKWLLLLVFFIAAVEVLGLTVVSVVLTGILSYIPNVFAAALIFGAGIFIANLVDGLVRGAVATVDHESARGIGKLARWVVLVVAFFAAIGQLQIAPALTDTFFQGLTWTLVLILGLSIGLGSKDIVAKILDDWYKKISK